MFITVRYCLVPITTRHSPRGIPWIIYTKNYTVAGDGVENAFAFTKKVFTFSMHKYSTGYFPGSGKLSDVGLGAAKYHCMNIPLKDGLNDLQYNYIFKR